MGTPFKKLAVLYSRLEQIPSYNSKRYELSEFFKSLDKKDVKFAAYLSLGTVGAKYEDTYLGVAEKMALRAVALAYSVNESKVKSLFSKEGDLGNAASLLNKRRKSTLTIKSVYETLRKIKDSSGPKSQNEKLELLSSLLKSSTSLESRYILRIVLRKLRMGVGEQALLDVFSLAFNGKRSAIEDAYNKCADIGSLAESLSKGKPITPTKDSGISLFRPVRAMLAQRVHKVSDIREKMKVEKFSAEEKYDGERIQIHKNGDSVRAFSRPLTDITSQYPEIIKSVKKQIKARKIILDGEIVAYEKGRLLSFQHLMQRRRKYKIAEYRKKIPVSVFLFDILYLDGKSLLKKSYPERRKILEKVLKGSGKLKLAKRVVSPDFSKIRKFFSASIKKGLEGIIVKSTAPDSFYSPGNRGWSWIKWKKEYAQDMQDTFDLVVVGSYPGRGRRKGHFGALLCAAYNPAKKRFETFTKVGTGYTDAQFIELSKMLRRYHVNKKPSNVSIEKSMEPSSYFKPGLVVEILGAEITHSPSHTCRKQKGKGLALRFPRFIRVRKDKRPKDATTTKEIKEMKNG